MNLRNDSDEIYYFIVDFFNDLTGMDKYSDKLWDLQSKGAKTNSPKTIGKELVTLFKNFLSDFEFAEYILFVGGVSSVFRVDEKINQFGIENVKTDAKNKMIEGLKEEAASKEYINNSSITDINILSFLEKIKFVVDNKNPSEYVKAIIKEHPRLVSEEKILNAIFNEIRDKQASKKNIQVVEGVVIETKDEALRYFRHLTASDVRLLTLQRIINRNPIEQGVPRSFIPILRKCPPEQENDFIQECQVALSKALFNKNSADEFWALLEDIYNNIITNPRLDVNAIYNLLDKDIKKNARDFDVLSLKYFIAQVKDGIQK
ncbi:MAG: hypothetical protein Q4D26_11580 [Clostridia bacterium]|nr:hypothetical protein [Clostridia bacterium]